MKASAASAGLQIRGTCVTRGSLSRQSLNGRLRPWRHNNHMAISTKSAPERQLSHVKLEYLSERPETSTSENAASRSARGKEAAKLESLRRGEREAAGGNLRWEAHRRAERNVDRRPAIGLAWQRHRIGSSIETAVKAGTTRTGDSRASDARAITARVQNLLHSTYTTCCLLLIDRTHKWPTIFMARIVHCVDVARCIHQAYFNTNV